MTFETSKKLIIGVKDIENKGVNLIQQLVNSLYTNFYQAVL